MPDLGPAPALLRLYLGLGRALGWLAAPMLRRRLARGKEGPDHWMEKLGIASQGRPDGPLIWLHAVGLGEVMALRGVIDRMAARAPDVSFLITSTARSSGQVIRTAPPPRTRHQFLPLDLPRPTQRFLDHWRPDVAVWAEQDLWPGLAWHTMQRGTPVAMINARINPASFEKRRKVRSLYAPILSRMALIAAQDPETASHLKALGASGQVAVTGPLKPASPPLSAAPVRLESLRHALTGRSVWCLASSHPADEALALAVEQARGPDSLLVIVPRDITRGAAIADGARAAGLAAQLQSLSDLPAAATRVFVADSFGELGLWYRLAPVSMIGGSFCEIEGHNPWEAVALGSAVLHGPRVANFTGDFLTLGPNGARQVETPAEIAAALGTDLSEQREYARKVAEKAAIFADDLADQILALVRRGAMN